MKLLSVVLGTLSVWAIACSGSESPSLFNDEQVIDPLPPDEVVPSFTPDSGTTTDTKSCYPKGESSFQALWHPPSAFGQKVCSAAQLDGYYTACLAGGINSTACKQFATESASCVKCLQSDEADANYGAVVWHRDRSYYTVNVAGCIARSLDDLTDTGCGATYAAAQECRRDACESCFSMANPSFQKFSACQTEASKSTCMDFSNAWKPRCPSLRTGATAQCLPAEENATAKDAYLKVAPLFCGQ